ncbi:MAG: hypothetical protein ACI8PZ_005515 [Myxococcota bacterium]
MRALLAIPLVLGGCVQTGVNALAGQVFRAETIGAAFYIERDARDSADPTRRVVLCDWDNGPFAGDFGTFYGTYDSELGTIELDDLPGAPLGVAERREAQAELFTLGDQGNTTPYTHAASWKAATADAPWGACGVTCDPADKRKAVETEWIDGPSPVATKEGCRDYCLAAAGEWMDCMHQPDLGDGGYCDCTEVTL